MTLFDKYKLVPFTPPISQILQQPEMKKLSDLDFIMREILERDLDETMKARLYESALQKFLTTKLQIQNDKAKTTEPEVKTSKYVAESLKNVIPIKYREKAMAFYTQLQNIPEFVINPDASYSYKDIRYSDSNIVELITHLMKPNLSHTKQPSGFPEFLNTMAELNVPVSFIPHKKRVQQIQKARKKLQWQPL